MSLVDIFLEESLLSEVKEVWLAIRTDGDGIGDGSRENPFGVNTAESFAEVMRDKTSAGTIIRLGPGIYHTRGMGGNGYVMDPEKVPQSLRSDWS